MSLPTKITVIGAGSASFEKPLSAACARRNCAPTLALVDRNPHSLAIVKRLADRLNLRMGCRLRHHRATPTMPKPCPAPRSWSTPA